MNRQWENLIDVIYKYKNLNFMCNLKERICATIGKMAPKWCVMNKYCNNQAYLWDLSSETEIEMIKTLGLAGDELRTREWHWKARIWLINQGIFV